MVSILQREIACADCGCRVWARSSTHRRCKACGRKVRAERRRRKRAGERIERWCQTCGASLVGRGSNAKWCRPCAKARYNTYRAERHAAMVREGGRAPAAPPRKPPEPERRAGRLYVPPPVAPASAMPLAAFMAAQEARLRSGSMPGKAGFHDAVESRWRRPA